MSRMRATLAIDRYPRPETGIVYILTEAVLQGRMSHENEHCLYLVLAEEYRTCLNRGRRCTRVRRFSALSRRSTSEKSPAAGILRLLYMMEFIGDYNRISIQVAGSDSCYAGD